jgi:hypothetical protein
MNEAERGRRKRKEKKGFILGGYSCNFFHSHLKIGKYCTKFLFKWNRGFCLNSHFFK